MTNWGKFETVDAKALNEEAKNLNSGDYPEVPVGKYEVAIHSMELKPTKKDGAPMLAVQFKILAGEYENSRLFYNQVIIRGDDKDAMRLSSANRFLKSTGTKREIIFEGVGAYEQMVEDIFEEVGDLEYLLDYSENKNGYKVFKIEEIFEAEE